MILSSDYIPVLFREVLSSVSTLMYHGTDSENLPSILSQGLIPNPKKKVWQDDPHMSFYSPSRESLGGVYLTSNLMTALSSAGKGKTKRQTIVAVQVQSGNLLADEDSIVYHLNGSVSDHEYTLMTLYAAWLALKNNLIEERWKKQEAQSHFIVSQGNFVENNIKFFEGAIKGGLTIHEKSLLYHILVAGFPVVLARKASHIDYWRWGTDEVYGVERPDIASSEADFKKLEDRLTRILKRLGRREHRERDFNHTARIETPITFTGKNKIISIVEYWYEREPKFKSFVRVIYPPSGQVPTKLVEDWEKAQGPWNPV